jgi:8-oxo-dGTP pyrophosphatase MutT (NUDIX family)
MTQIEFISFYKSAQSAKSLFRNSVSVLSVSSVIRLPPKPASNATTPQSLRLRDAHRLDGTRELLIFYHRDVPDAGTQIPGGGVDEGETYAQAALRELHEEAGLTGLPITGPIDTYDWTNPEIGNVHQRQVFHAETTDLPDGWHHTVHGAGDDVGRVFVYFWIPLSDAMERLTAIQGTSAKKIHS